MRRILLTGILALLVVLAGCGSNEPAQTTINTESVDTAVETGDSSINMSDMESLIASGDEIKCTMIVEGSTQEVWIKSEEKFRVEATVHGMKSNMVYDGDAVYQWNEGENTGIMFDMKKMEERADDYESEGQMEAPKGLDDISDVAVNIDCEKTSISNSLVSKPSGVEFQDFSAMREDMMAQFEGMEGDQ